MSYYETNGGNFVIFRQAALKLAHKVRYQGIIMLNFNSVQN